MKNNKWKSYAFWMSVVAAIIVVLNAFGETFGFSIDEVAITSIGASVCGLLVVLGILSKKDKTEDSNNSEEQGKEESDDILDEK